MGGVLNAEDKAPTLMAHYSKESGATSFLGERHSYSVAKAERIPEYSVDKARCLNSHYANNSGTGEGSLEQRLFSDNKAKQQVDLIAENVGGVDYVQRKLSKLCDKLGYAPTTFTAYNEKELTEKSNTLTSGCGSKTTSSAVLTFEKEQG